MIQPNKAYWTPLRITFLVLIILSYLFFHNYYRVEYLDDPWTLSWAYNWWTNGEVFDTVFGYLDGDGGTSLFSRTYVFVYGAFSQLFGWTRGGSYLLSTIFVLTSLSLWKLIWQELKFDKETASDFLLISLLFDPYFGIAHKARVDALTLFFCTLTLYHFLRKRYLFSGLFMLIAFETHPMGITSLFYILAYLFVIRKDMAANPRFYIEGALKFIGGCLLGLAYYLSLHYSYLANLADLGGRSTGHAFLAYFFTQKMSWRHWPEIVLILFSLVIFLIKKQYKQYKTIFPFITGALITSFLLHRSNMHYVVYLFPPIIMLIILTFKEIKLTNLLLIGFLIFQIPQYGYLYYTQKEYNHKEYISGIRNILNPEEIGDTFVYGTYNGWFALKETNYHCYGYFGRSRLGVNGLPDHFYLLENQLYHDQEYSDDLERLIKEKQQKENFTYQITELGQVNFLKNNPLIIKEYKK
jgi:hypothetical protein